MEVSAQIEIAILSGWKLGEIDRVIGRNEAWYVSLDRSVEQNRLRFHDYVPQSLQSGHHAGRTRACRCHFGSAAQVDTGNRYAELLQSLKLVSRRAVANQRFYAGSPFEQSSRDASAEITGSSRHNDDRVVHDPDINERAALMQFDNNFLPTHDWKEVRRLEVIGPWPVGTRTRLQPTSAGGLFYGSFPKWMEQELEGKHVLEYI